MCNTIVLLCIAGCLYFNFMNRCTLNIKVLTTREKEQEVKKNVLLAAKRAAQAELDKGLEDEKKRLKAEEKEMADELAEQAKEDADAKAALDKEINAAVEKATLTIKAKMLATSKRFPDGKCNNSNPNHN